MTLFPLNPRHPRNPWFYSHAADCIAVVVSASSGQVTLFRRGVMFPLLEKPIAGHA